MAGQREPSHEGFSTDEAVEEAISPVSFPPAAVPQGHYTGLIASSAQELNQPLNARYPSSEKCDSSIDEARVDSETMKKSESSSTGDGFSKIMASLNNPSRNRWRYMATLSCLFANGIGDAATGVVIPSMEAEYGVSYGIVSIIFVGQALGFIAAATYTNWLYQKVGRAKHMLMAQLALVAGYIIISTAPPFWLVCVGFFLVGTGMGVPMAPNFVFVCSLDNATTLLGIFHGVYGIGATFSPLMATAMINAHIKWSFFYLIMVVISVFNAVANYWSNLGYEQDQPGPLSMAMQDIDKSQGAGSADRCSASTSSTSAWKQTLSRTTLLAACFIFAYQGGEVAVSGWVPSFLLGYRNPPYWITSPPVGPSGYNPLANGASAETGLIGYVTSGFWGGLTLSRLFAVKPLSQRLGDVLSIWLLVTISIGFQLVVWLVPNLVVESVAIAILGALLGPIWPLATFVFNRQLDEKVQTSSLSVVTAMGSSGGAVVPLMVGLVSQDLGVWVLHPICIGGYVLMGLCWLGLTLRRSK